MKNRIIYVLALLFVALQTFAQTYTYDTNNRLTKVVYDNGVTVNYTYDALGNRTGKTVTGATSTKYTITTSVTPAGSGSVTGAGTYGKGTTVELSAMSNAGYKFQQWSDGVASNPRTVIVSKNQSFKAQFTESGTVPDILGDIVEDGKVNNMDLGALVEAYINNTKVTEATDIDEDGSLSIADITWLVDIINEERGILNSNGHEFVDLGLPSGTLWATCNIGATIPEETGDYYAWGETETKDVYSWETYKWCDGSECSSTNQTLTKYCDRGAYGAPDGKISLDLVDDVAHVKWGGDWHIPTENELQELIDYCSFEIYKMSNKEYACKFTGRNGNCIILPYAGCMKNESHINGLDYWSSCLSMNSIPINNKGTQAKTLDDFYDEEGDYDYARLGGKNRYRGLPVRPVLSKYSQVTHKIFGAPSTYQNREVVDMGLPSASLWATCNLGATKPEEYGCYYAWGETTGSCDGKTTFKESTYTTDMTNYVEPGDILDISDDAAAANWGGEWRMPTSSDLRELADARFTTWEWTQVNGVNGYRVTSVVKGFEGNTIFLPAAGSYRYSEVKYAGDKGYYWSSTLNTGPDSSYNAVQFYMSSDNTYKTSGSSRYYGNTIRPIVYLDTISK